LRELTLLDSQHPVFPHPENALRDPDGLLAVGGNLSVNTLLSAYHQGIFPWYEEGQPVLWWSPAPRAVLFPEHLHVSRTLRRSWRRGDWRVAVDTSFLQVVESCAAPRAKASGTWITPEMKAAYLALHRSGHAHSVEIWSRDRLVGGLYGVMVGSVFCGESMFSREPDASKVALTALAGMLLDQSSDSLIDCQIINEHLLSLGAVAIPRREFLARLMLLRDRKFDWSAVNPAKALSKLMSDR
jgi:leucyl/phenylalanyl-tRNA--protein transferase